MPNADLIIPVAEQQEVNQLVLDGQFDEAQLLLKNSLSKLTATVKEEVKLAVSSRQKIDDVMIREYLKYAPEATKEAFEDRMTIMMFTDQERAQIMKHIHYLPDSIRFLDEDGKEICVMDNKDLEVPDDKLKDGSIEKRYDTTYFKRDALMAYATENDIQIPDAGLYEQLLSLIPAVDDANVHRRASAIERLYRLMGGKNNGYIYRTLLERYYVVGCLWSSSKGDEGYALALPSEFQVINRLRSIDINALLPARALKKPVTQ